MRTLSFAAVVGTEELKRQLRSPKCCMLSVTEPKMLHAFLYLRSPLLSLFFGRAFISPFLYKSLSLTSFQLVLVIVGRMWFARHKFKAPPSHDTGGAVCSLIVLTTYMKESRSWRNPIVLCVCYLGNHKPEDRDSKKNSARNMCFIVMVFTCQKKSA
jgi:hypothetical protein